MRLMAVNTELAAHLSLFQKMHFEVGMTLDEIKRTMAQPPDPDAQAEVDKRARRLAWMATAIAEHASCASWLINRLILSPAHLLLRLKRLVWKTARDRECRTRLQAGSSEGTAPDQV